MKKIKEILKLRFITDISFRQIGKAVNIPSSTVSDYCKRFEISKHTLDECLKMEEESIYQLLFASFPSGRWEREDGIFKLYYVPITQVSMTSHPKDKRYTI